VHRRERYRVAELTLTDKAGQAPLSPVKTEGRLLPTLWRIMSGKFSTAGQAPKKGLDLLYTCVILQSSVVASLEAPWLAGWRRWHWRTRRGKPRHYGWKRRNVYY